MSLGGGFLRAVARNVIVSRATGFFMNYIIEQQLAALLDAMDEGAFVVDTQGVVLRWNRGMERISGYGAAEVVGTLRGEQNCPFEIGELALFDAMPENGVEVSLKQRGGEVVTVLKSTRAIKDSQGNVLGAIVCLKDLSVVSALRSEIEELKALKDEVLTLRGLVDGVPGAAPMPTASGDLPPAFQLSSQRYRKAEGRRKELLHMLIECRWNKSEVARRLGITRVSVWRRMKQLGLPLEAPESDRDVGAVPLEKDASSAAATPKQSPKNTARPAVRRRPQSIDLSWD